MFKPPLSEKDLAEMAAAGLTPEDFGGGDVEVWPENAPAFFLFHAYQTQWRSGPMGPIGLDYTPFFHKMDRMKLSPEEYEELEDDIRTMEYAALAAMSSKTD